MMSSAAEVLPTGGDVAAERCRNDAAVPTLGMKIPKAAVQLFDVLVERPKSEQGIGRRRRRQIAGAGSRRAIVVRVKSITRQRERLCPLSACQDPIGLAVFEADIFLRRPLRQQRDGAQATRDKFLDACSELFHVLGQTARSDIVVGGLLSRPEVIIVGSRWAGRLTARHRCSGGSGAFYRFAGGAASRAKALEGLRQTSY